ncbi:hypothetical protein BH09GEM1_BH09GEM1_43430 [soil metagenome]
MSRNLTRITLCGAVLLASTACQDTTSTSGSALTRAALSAALSLSLMGTNLLNHQVGEPDNITVVPGRAILLGLHTTF